MLRSQNVIRSDWHNFLFLWIPFSHWSNTTEARYWLKNSKIYSVHAHQLLCTGLNMCSEICSMSSWSHRYLNYPNLTPLSKDMGRGMQEDSVPAHSPRCTGHNICSKKLLAYPPDIIDTPITLIQHIWEMIWAQVYKNNVCMTTGLCAQVSISAQNDLHVSLIS